MQKKLTVLFAFAIFVLVVGWAITPAQAHCSLNPTHIHKKKPCMVGDEGDIVRYDVTVDGDLFPEALPELQTYVGTDGGGRSKPVNVGFQPLNLDLGFFSGANTIDPDGNCFDKAPVLGKGITISQEKDGSPIVQYWFTGFGNDETGTKVDYLLEMFGDTDISGAWRPVNDTTTVHLTSWEMSINGKLEIACIGSGEDFHTVIDVTEPHQIIP